MTCLVCLKLIRTLNISFKQRIIIDKMSSSMRGTSAKL